uniref:Uncharacterized protein n=1 Tax=Dulem virus 215 TaxID=3145692 RepID=A0AAU8AZ82_9VIRU
MIKTILFIYLELFTIRHYRDYDLSSLKSAREFISKCISDNEDYLVFKIKCYGTAVMLNPIEYAIIRDFISYLNDIDKYLKI